MIFGISGYFMGKDRKRKIIMWWRELAWKAIHIGSSDVGNRGQAQRSPR